MPPCSCALEQAHLVDDKFLRPMLERHWHIVRAGPHTTRLAWRAAAKSGAIGGRNGSRRNRALWSASIDGVLHATARRALEHHVVANGGVFRGTATTIVVPAQSSAYDDE